MRKVPTYTLIFTTVVLALLILPSATASTDSIQNVRLGLPSLPQPPLPCAGPHITATIDRTEVTINQTVTVTGQISPPEPNATVRVTFVRPNYTWIEQFVQTDPETGKFTTAPQPLDMGGYWNIFPVHGHISDRLHVVVDDPSTNPGADFEFQNPWKPNLPLVGAAIALTIIGIIVAVTGLKKKTRKISSIRLCIQVLLIFIIFFGMFVDHQFLPRPVRQIAVHDFLVGTDVFGVAMPDGFPGPSLLLLSVWSDGELRTLGVAGLYLPALLGMWPRLGCRLYNTSRFIAISNFSPA